MIPIKSFKDKKYSLSKEASYLPKNAEIIKHFRMSVLDFIKPKQKRKKK